MEQPFPGQYHDQETGLNYNYFRSYNPATGRYTQSDPIGLYGGLNTYRYAEASPLSVSDFYGLIGGTTVDAYCRQHPSECAALGLGGPAAAQAASNAARDAASSSDYSDSDDCGGCESYEYVYHENPKHRARRYYQNGKSIARRPTNGQIALNNSVPASPDNSRRVGFDKSTGELVVLPRTRVDNVNCIMYFHGWVADYYDDIYGRPKILRAARDAGFPIP